MVSSEFQSDIQPFCVLISRRSRSRHRAAHALNSFHEVQQRRVWKRATHMSFSTFPMAGRVTQARGITISDFIFRHRTGDFSEKEPAECFRVKFAARWTVLHDHRSSCPPLQQVYSILRPEHPARMIGVSFKQNIVGWRWFQKPKWAMYRLDARIRRVYQTVWSLGTGIGFQIMINCRLLLFWLRISIIRFLHPVELAKNEV